MDIHILLLLPVAKGRALGNYSHAIVEHVFFGTCTLHAGWLCAEVQTGKQMQAGCDLDSNETVAEPVLHAKMCMSDRLCLVAHLIHACHSLYQCVLKCSEILSVPQLCTEDYQVSHKYSPTCTVNG